MDEFGFEFDRNWVIATVGSGSWEMVTQRKYPSMVLIQPKIKRELDTVLVVNAPNMNELRVPIQSGPSVPITVWKSTVFGISQGKEAQQWFSKFLGFECELFLKDRSTARTLTPKHTPHPSLFSYQPQTAFADGFPFLVLSHESLLDFQSCHPEPDKITSKTFRANIIIQGCYPYQEDTFMTFQVGDVEFVATARCTRCVMTNNTETGVPITSTLKLLQKTRRVDPGAKYEACMGINAIHCSLGGTIKVGDSVVVHSNGNHDRRGIWNGLKAPAIY